MEINMMFIGLTEFLDTHELYNRFNEYLNIYAYDEFDSIACDIIVFPNLFMREANFLQSLMPHNTERHWKNLSHWLF